MLQRNIMTQQQLITIGSKDKNSMTLSSLPHSLSSRYYYEPITQPNLGVTSSHNDNQ